MTSKQRSSGHLRAKDRYLRETLMGKSFPFKNYTCGLILNVTAALRI